MPTVTRQSAPRPADLVPTRDATSWPRLPLLITVALVSGAVAALTAATIENGKPSTVCCAPDPTPRVFLPPVPSPRSVLAEALSPVVEATDHAVPPSLARIAAPARPAGSAHRRRPIPVPRVGVEPCGYTITRQVSAATGQEPRAAGAAQCDRAAVTIPAGEGANL